MESPRWSASQGKVKEAKKFLKMVSKLKRKDLPLEVVDASYSTSTEEVRIIINGIPRALDYND